MGKERHIVCTSYEVFNGELEQAFSTEKTFVNTINQYCIAEKDAEFKNPKSR